LPTHGSDTEGRTSILDPESDVSDRPVVMAVASYPSRAIAERDLEALCGARPDGERATVTAAIVEKGADGLLTIGQQKTAERFAYGAVVLGGALIVLAAPLGVLFLVPVLATKTAWAGVGAVVAHFWNNVPKAELRDMSDLLESTQAVLVVVALDHEHDEIKPLLARSSTTILSDVSAADLEAEFCNAVAEADAIDG
jgi:hypothetical protein